MAEERCLPPTPSEAEIGLRPPEPWPVRYPHPLSEATGRAILEEVRAIRALLDAGVVFDVGQPIGKERS